MKQYDYLNTFGWTYSFDAMQWQLWLDENASEEEEIESTVELMAGYRLLLLVAGILTLITMVIAVLVAMMLL